MNSRKAKLGFSIVELMVVIVIVALLVALAVPSYTRYIRKSNRAEAQQLMLQYANNQEIWRANDSNYATSGELAVPTHNRYVFYTRATGTTCGNQNPTATNFTVVACASGDQAADEEQATSCSTLTLDQANAKTPAVCW